MKAESAKPKAIHSVHVSIKTSQVVRVAQIVAQHTRLKPACGTTDLPTGPHNIKNVSHETIGNLHRGRIT